MFQTSCLVLYIYELRKNITSFISYDLESVPNKNTSKEGCIIFDIVFQELFADKYISYIDFKEKMMSCLIHSTLTKR